MVPDRPKAGKRVHRPGLLSQSPARPFTGNASVKGLSDSSGPEPATSDWLFCSGQVIWLPLPCRWEMLLEMKPAEFEADHCNNKNGQQLRGDQKGKREANDVHRILGNMHCE